MPWDIVLPEICLFVCSFVFNYRHQGKDFYENNYVKKIIPPEKNCRPGKCKWIN